MPLARYFLFVGGVLLALLFVASSMLPTSPMAESADLGTEKSFLKIDSDRKWPDRIVFGTSVPQPVPSQIATSDDSVAPAAAGPVADVSDKARDAFAQLEPSDRKKSEPKPPVKRKTARRRPTPPTVLVAQQPRFGFFASSFW